MHRDDVFLAALSALLHRRWGVKNCTTKGMVDSANELADEVMSILSEKRSFPGDGYQPPTDPVNPPRSK